MTPRQQAVRIIRAEHQTLTAVIDAYRHVADDIAAGRLTPDYRLLWSVIYYIEAFPDTLHHPKEDEVLFPAVRARTRDIDDTLDELGRQHVNSHPHLDMLKTLQGRMEAGIPGATAAWCAKVGSYASFHHAHMALEETVVLPKAGEVLTEGDWQRIADSFAAHTDPLADRAASGDEWFRGFYRRIVALVPEPWGVGPRR